jgi:ubiquinone/menaquinone biosynthesis C-methylase UbiE
MTNQQDHIATSFRDVDRLANIERTIRFLDTLQSLAGMQRYKNRTFELLPRPTDASVLDVGCGLGDDVAKLKQRFVRAVGIDSSSYLIEEAIRRHRKKGCEFRYCDARHLPFKDEEFDAARVDRSLQHIESPVDVVREMMRVVKKGGTILCAEPEWGSVFIATPFSAVTMAIQNRWIESTRNPWIGRNLFGILHAAGLTDLSIEAWTVLTEGFGASDLAFDIVNGIEQLRIAGWNELELAGWLNEYKQSAALAGVTIIVCHGRKL